MWWDHFLLSFNVSSFNSGKKKTFLLQDCLFWHLFIPAQYIQRGPINYFHAPTRLLLMSAQTSLSLKIASTTLIYEKKKENE